MQGVGWVKLHRELQNNIIWVSTTPEQKVIFLAVLMLVNWSPNSWEWKGQKYFAKPGQTVTSVQSICEIGGIGITPQKVKTSLKKFEKWGFLTNESTKQGRLITITNWAKYQKRDEKLTNDLTIEQPTTNRQLTTIEEGKKERRKGSSENYFSADSPEVELCFLMAEKIKETYPGAKLPNSFQKWALDFNRLIRLDGRSCEEIKRLIEWIYRDEFWLANIRSPGKLRDKWETCWLQMEQKQKRASEKTSPVRERVIES